MRRNRKRSSTDVYKEITKNLESCWIAALVLSPFVIYQLFSFLEGKFAIVNFVIFIFITLIFIQSIRGIVILRQLKRKVLIKPDSVNISQVYAAPSIRRFMWFVD
ncbi:MAG: hypothetical protein AB8B80_07815 [Marinicellaceae bacterium]